MRNIAWIILFIAVLCVAIMLLGYIFGHGLLHFIGCAVGIALVYWAAHEVSNAFRLNGLDEEI